MASIYRRKERGPYYITYLVRPGVRRTVKGCHDKAATESLAHKLEADAMLRREGVIDARADQYAAADAVPLIITDADGKITSGHVEDFYKALVAKGGTAKNAESKRAQAVKIIKLSKARRISDLNPFAVQATIHGLREDGKSLQTCNHYLRAIKQFDRWLWRDGRARENTLAHLSRFNVQLDRRHDRRALTDEEVTKLIDAAGKGPVLHGISGHDRAMLYRIAAGTGFRRNEIASLTLESFDLDSSPPTITVEAAYSKHRRRDVHPIRRDLADLLRTWLAWKKPKQPVINTSKWNWHRTSDMMKTDLAAAEVAYKDNAGHFADFHSLRHTYITNIGRLPVSMKTHQELARHSEPGLTMRYTHPQMADKVKALEALPPVNPTEDKPADTAVA